MSRICSPNHHHGPPEEESTLAVSPDQVSNCRHMSHCNQKEKQIKKTRNARSQRLDTRPWSPSLLPVLLLPLPRMPWVRAGSTEEGGGKEEGCSSNGIGSWRGR